jgi:Gp157 protein
VSLSLYTIESDLLELAQLRETAELEGDSEALKVIDQQIREYIELREPRKVANYVNLLRTWDAEAEACEKEAERFATMAKQRRANIERLKAQALAVMQQFDIKELRAAPVGGLRRQGNGGLEPLDIAGWPRDSSGRFEMIPEADWRRMLPPEFLKLYFAPNTEKLREALKTSVVNGAKLLPRGEHVRVL